MFKRSFRQAVAKRQARMHPVSLANSPSRSSASIFYTPSPSPTPTSRLALTPNGSSSAFTPVIRNESLTSKFLESAQTEMASLQLTPNMTPIQSAYSNILLGLIFLTLFLDFMFIVAVLPVFLLMRTAPECSCHPPSQASPTFTCQLITKYSTQDQFRPFSHNFNYR